MTKELIKEYISTVIKTVFFVFIILVVVYLNLDYRVSNQRITTKEDKMVDAQLWKELVEEYKAAEQNHPEDHTLNIQLGTFYELLEEYDKAELEYNKAIKKTKGYAYSPFFKLAKVKLLKQERKEALYLVENIKNLPKGNILKEKASFYREYAYLLYEEGDYETALDAFQNELYFLNKIKKSSTEEVNTNIIKCYLSMAENALKKANIDDAILNLEKALEYRNDKLIIYKLAILYMDVDIKKSLKYFEKTFATNPSLINYDLYEKAYQKLMQQDFKKGLYQSVKIDSLKLNKIKRFKTANVTCENDFAFNLLECNIIKKFFGIEQKLLFSYTVTNLTEQSINKLYSYIEIYVNKAKVTTIKDEIALPKEKLEAKSSSKIFAHNINLKEYEVKNGDKITIKLYIVKNLKFNSIKIFETRFFVK